MLPIKTRASPKAHQGGPELQCKYRSPAQRARRGGGACSEDVPDKDVAQVGLPRETWERPPSDTSMVIQRKAETPQRADYSSGGAV